MEWPHLGTVQLKLKLKPSHHRQTQQFQGLKAVMNDLSPLSLVMISLDD